MEEGSNKLFEVLERREVALAVTISQRATEATIQSIAATADVAEIRADTYRGSRAEIMQRMYDCPLPVLLTIRSVKEGGEWSASETDRLEQYERLMSHSQAVDIELHAAIAPRVCDLGKRMGNAVIGSFHDFEKTPQTAELEEKYDLAGQLGVDYLKLALQMNSQEDYDRAAAFTVRHANDGVIVMGMGEIYGPESRKKFSVLGSQMVYAHDGLGAVAPGQMDYLETHYALTEEDRAYADILA